MVNETSENTFDNIVDNYHSIIDDNQNLLGVDLKHFKEDRYLNNIYNEYKNLIEERDKQKENDKIFYVNKNLVNMYSSTKKILNTVENVFYIYFFRIIMYIFIFIDFCLVIYFSIKYKNSKNITYLNYAIWLVIFLVLFFINYLIIQNRIIINI